MRTAVVLNPRANAGNGARRWTQFLATEPARVAGLPRAIVFDGSRGLEHLGDWLSEQIRAGAKRVVAAGGDGTMNLALNSLLRAPERTADIAFGAVGLGSSNDFQKPFGAPGRGEVGKLHYRLDFDRTSPHDIGRSVADGRERYFAINASVGVTAEANWNFNEAQGALASVKRHWVDGAIVATALKTFRGYRNFEARLSLDGSPARALALSNLGVVKIPYFSGSMRYDQAPARDDGQFGVHACEGMGRVEMIALMAALSAGRFSGRRKTSSQVARHISLEADAPFAVETDGEVARARRVEFSVLPKEALLCP